jgi:SapC
MEIPLPPGFRSAVPFDRQAHRRYGIPADAAKFARKLNIIYIATAEFARACHDFPIAFARDGTGNVVPLVLTGLDEATNLFIDERGAWAPGVYCPAFVRRYPFFTATIADDGAERALICVDENALSTDAPSLVDAAGEPTDRWREVELLVTEMDAEQRKTAALCSRLDELDLLEAFEADFHPRGRPEIRVAGLLRVNEQRLGRLHGDDLASLMRDGYLARIYAHLLSFENFNRLLNRYLDPA